MDKIVYNYGFVCQIPPWTRRFRIQTTDYTKGDVFQAEKRAVFAAGWLPLCAEGQIARPGDFMPLSVGGWSAVAVRDMEGTVRVLRNTCRHQTMPVVGTIPGNCEKFRCRFHGWTYDLQGRFLAAPSHVEPADPTPGANDLRTWPVRRLDGLVFFAPGRQSSSFFPPDPGQPYAGTIVTDIACNWKVCVEHLLGEPEVAWFWPLLAVRRSGPAVIVEQVVPHTFLRTRLFSHVFGGTVEAQRSPAVATKETCERQQLERAAGTPPAGNALLAQFHETLRKAYDGNS